MNGSQGITPTIELASANNGNGFYPYPVYPMMNGGFGGNNGFLGGDGIWLIVLLALIWGGNGNNGWGGFGGGNSFDNGYAWLSNGQKEIMQNTNNGFDTLHLSNQLDTVNSGIYSLSNQLCNTGHDITNAVSNGFYNAEISANNRQMANMNTAFDLSRQFADCCCENRLGIADLKSTILSENCADRALLADSIKDVLINQTANTQRILDQLCNDKIDEKNEKIADLQRQLSMADLKASQVAQNAFISQGFANEVDALYNRLSNCPVPSTPVYGRTPIFTCPQNNGCGYSGYATNII
jgi:hypothetical protein